MIRLPVRAIEAIRAHARAAYPEECCGALLGCEAGDRARTVVRVVAAENRWSGGGERGYLIPADRVRGLEAEAKREGLAVLGFYHSHPEGPPEPSGADREDAWPWYSYLIVAVAGGIAGEVRGWRLREDREGFHREDVVPVESLMSVQVRLPSPLRACADGRAEVAVQAATVGDALARLMARYPQLRRHLFADDGRLRAFVNVYLNEDDVRDLEGQRTALADGDVVTIVPSIAGGSEAAPSAPDAATRRGGGSERGPGAELSPEEVYRYSRHIILPEVGWEGQRKLKAARVLLVGAGGLGSPLGLYLAAAGVGTLGVVDFDVVDATNLQRQVLYGTSDVGRPKLEAAAERLRGVNPHVELVPHPVRLTSENALGLFESYDIVVDGSDNFPTRYLVNDACVLLGKPNVYGSIFRFEGQVSVFGARGGPCYRCLFREPPPPGLVPSCAEGGVLGVLPGIIGTLQGLETIKLVVGCGEPLIGRLLLFDALALRWRELRLRRNPECPACGERPTLTGLIDYEEFCGMKEVQGQAAQDDAVPEITPTELKARLDLGERLAIIDVREPHEWEIANLEPYGARLIPMSQIGERLAELDREAEVVLQCRSGARSARALRQLQVAGFRRLWNLKGGILAWADEVDPSLRKY